MEFYKGNVDFCGKIEDPDDREQMEVLELFGIPTECPMPEGRICVDNSKEIDVSRLQSYLPILRGQLLAIYDIQHENVSELMHSRTI